MPYSLYIAAWLTYLLLGSFRNLLVRGLTQHLCRAICTVVLYKCPYAQHSVMLAKGSGKAAQSEVHVSTTVHVYTSEHQPAISSGYAYIVC